MESYRALKRLARKVVATVLLASSSAVLSASAVTVYKDAGCGCCAAWVDHLKANGLPIAAVHDVPDMTPHKQKFGVPERLASCHTAVVEGYTIEGHVPASDIKRLLSERPKAKGLAVPGMPHGSPGMETGRFDPYDVLLFDANGKTRVYQSYRQRTK